MSGAEQGMGKEHHSVSFVYTNGDRGRLLSNMCCAIQEMTLRTDKDTGGFCGKSPLQVPKCALHGCMFQFEGQI